MSTITNKIKASSSVETYETELEYVRPNIYITPSIECPDFSSKVKDIIAHIEANPIGHRLLEKIRRCKSQYITILHSSKDLTMSNGTRKPVIVNCSLEDLSCFSSQGETIPIPNYVVLFHELTHAYHILSKKRSITSRADPLIWASDEEYHTIMGFPYKNPSRTTPKITENAFRRAEGLPERFGHIHPETLQTPFEKSLLTRLKLLGNLHEKLQSAHSSSEAPPPIAKCSKATLGESNAWIVTANIRGVNPDFTPNLKTVSQFHHIYTPDIAIDEAISYVEDADVLTHVVDLLPTYFPKLNEVSYFLKSLSIVRCSEEEAMLLRS